MNTQGFSSDLLLILMFFIKAPIGFAVMAMREREKEGEEEREGERWRGKGEEERGRGPWNRDGEEKGR